MALCNLGYLGIRLLWIRHAFFGGGGGGGSDAQREKVLFLLPPKEKGNKVCLIAGYCQRHSVAFYHNIKNL